MSDDPLVILPNVEAFTSQFLRDQPEVGDALTAAGGDADGVFTAIPKRPTYPLVRVTAITENKLSTRPLWIFRATVQIEAFGGTKAQAHEIGRTCEGVMAARMIGVQDDAVVVGVDHGAFIDLPDETFEPAKPRWILTSTITAHPLATVPS